MLTIFNAEKRRINYKSLWKRFLQQDVGLDQVYQAAGSGFTLIDGNGTTANGTAVDLGGALTEDVNIDGSYALNMGITSPLTTISLIGSTYVLLGSSALGATGNVGVNAAGASLGYRDGGGVFTGIEAGTMHGGVRIVDGLGSKGAVYPTDYSANYTARSLVDKEYVDTNFVSGYTFQEGLTESSGTVELGSSDNLTKDIILRATDGNGFFNGILILGNGFATAMGDVGPYGIGENGGPRFVAELNSLYIRSNSTALEINSSNQMVLDTPQGLFCNDLKSGVSQVAAGAAANELWVDTANSNVVKLGV